jgi:SAM-dependent methyltransferase
MPLRVKEMMYGMPNSFEYGLCQDCQCLQILEIPNNLSDFYPKNYYSYSEKVKKRPFKNWQRAIKRQLILNHPPFLSFLFSSLKKSYSLFWMYRKMGVKKNDAFLDVGAGSGAHVLELRSANILSMGIDPFIEKDIVLNESVIVKKAHLKDLHQQFDVISFHHSFEHIAEQLETLVQAKALLKPNGKILIRIPTTSSWAFTEYQENWCQLDAPRHLYLHSHASIELLATQVNLEVLDLWCDSSEMQFIASEQYLKGITLLDPKSYAVNKKASPWTKEQVKAFQDKAKVANAALKGDQICVLLG